MNLTNTEVFFKSSTDNGTTWSALFQISNANGRSEDPNVAAEGSNVYIVWNDNRSGTMETWYRHSSDDANTWGQGTEMKISLTY